MLKVERLLQLLVLALVSFSGLLLGVGQQDYGLSLLAAGSALAAFIFNDLTGWFRLNRWLANIAAIVITAFSLRNFFTAQSTEQLVMIANLLVYLQVVLLFQRKTPRVFWQVMVLSLLQVVVAAAFNIGFEGGVVFFIYMLLCGSTMMVLHLHGETFGITENNRQMAESAINASAPQPLIASSNPGVATQVSLPKPRLFAVFDQVCQRRGVVRQMLGQIFSVGIVAIGFATVAFYFLPRDESVWTGSQISQVERPGSSKSIDLELDGRIFLSKSTAMKMTLLDPNGKTVELVEKPYIRGLPLPNLRIKNGQTSWEAPYDRIYRNDRVVTPGLPSSTAYLLQRFEVESSNDPLVHAIAPAYRTANTMGNTNNLQYSRALDAISQFSYADDILYADKSMDSKTTYELLTPVLAGNGLYLATPYRSHPLSPEKGMAGNIGEYKWLTAIDKSRYPTLVREAERVVAARNLRGNHRRMALELTDYLARAGGFEYTLDFKNFGWAPGVDHVEDFISSKKRGHCELFASSLTLMLRSQGIPARLVVGYHGGEFDKSDGSYDVQLRHAHAWVEAYIRADDCPIRWVQTGQADANGGAWMRLDPTPPSENDEGDLDTTQALDYAKDFWDNYVMGLDKSKQKDTLIESFLKDPMKAISNLISAEYWNSQVRSLRDSNSWITSPIAIWSGAILIILAIGWTYRRQTRSAPRPGMKRQPPLFQRALGRAISLVAPRLGRWVAGESEPSQSIVEFYQRFSGLMSQFGLERSANQTQQEFALAAAQHFSSLPAEGSDSGPATGQTVSQAIQHVTDWFYRVRFGQAALDKPQLDEIEKTLSDLEAELAQSPAGSKVTS